MTDFQQRRKKAGMSQFLLARWSGISRMRLSLAETGQVALTDHEEVTVRRSLNEYIELKSREIALLCQESRASA